MNGDRQRLGGAKCWQELLANYGKRASTLASLEPDDRDLDVNYDFLQALDAATKVDSKVALL